MNSSNGLIDQSAALAAKAAMMSQYMSKLEVLSPVSKLAWDPYTPYAKREPFIRIMMGFESEARAMMTSKIKATIATLSQQIEALNAANLQDKPDILKTIPIITVPVGASYLGINESELHRLKNIGNGLFGARYLGRQCYSMDELELISQNPKWMSEFAKAKGQESIKLPNLAVLNQFIHVDCAVALAFTNLNSSELSHQIQASYYSYRTYRLADLEKIRIAKLTEKAALRPIFVQCPRTKLLVLEAM